MTDKLPPQWAIDKAGIVLVHLEYSLSDYTRKTATAKIARLLAEERELARSEIFEWVRNNMTFYNTSETNRPVLAAVSSRIWYHATDSAARPFDAVIAESLGES